jgi:hypothetical protein
MTKTKLIQDALSVSKDRRGLLKKLAFAGVAVAASHERLRAQAPSAVDVVQFALNLEYLEAEF